MIPKSIIPLAALAAQVAAIPHAPRDETPGIEWKDCNADVQAVAAVPVQCANISVPLDYTDRDSGGTHTLELIKAPALEGPAVGNIIFNFGGPGVEGLVSLAQSGAIYGA